MELTRKKILFIDRDGTLALEPEDEQLDAVEKLIFYPGALHYLPKIAKELDYELVMVTNQDGLGTDSHPEEHFWPVHELILRTFAGEGASFNAVHIDRTFPAEGATTRKPGVGMLQEYFDEKRYDLANSFVIGDRVNDLKLAENLGAKAIWLTNASSLQESLGAKENWSVQPETIALQTAAWEEIYAFLRLGQRKVVHARKTRETNIHIEMDLDGRGQSSIHTGLGFFDHMLDQLAKHGQMDLSIQVQGDLEVDEHHTIEDTGIALGEAFALALGDKRGVERYAFVLPMDDCLAQVAIDFGGRNWIVWDADFKREMIGDMPTEMFFHFFKSFSDAAKCNLNIQASGTNEHHKIESIFKAFAKAIRKAVKRDVNFLEIPSTKGTL